MKIKEYLKSYEKLLLQATKGEATLLDCLNRKLDIENIVVNLEDGEESEIIRRKYIKLRTWKQICEDSHVSHGQADRIHRRALENREIILYNYKYKD